MQAGCSIEDDAGDADCDAPRDRERPREERSTTSQATSAKPEATSAPPEATSAPQQTSSVSEWFHRFAQHTSNVVGKPATFVAAVLLIVVWAVTGPFMGFSETWQLIINTGTTILTFLMVFLIQNTQNRDARAIHLKLDELIHGVKGARNRVIDLENCTDEELADLEKEFKRLRERDENARGSHAEPEQMNAR